MTAHDLVQLLGPFVVAVALAVPTARYVARVLGDDAPPLARLIGPLERGVYRAAGVDAEAPMSARQYAMAFLASQAVGVALVMGVLIAQGWLPGNPDGLPGVAWHTALNTAVSFVTNTNWQSYGGETTMSYLSQAGALAVQNFVSAGAGIAVAAAVSRGFARRQRHDLGNYWRDLVRAILYLLAPLSIVVSLLLVSEGVPQTVEGAAVVTTVEQGPAGEDPTTQTIALGPIASQVAIKQLGTNGGGFYNVNSAHPLENPTPLSNLIELVCILWLPAAMCLAFGHLVGDRRQGWALLGAMTLLFVPLLLATGVAESWGNPALALDGVAPAAGSLEGKEVRFGVAGSAAWAAFTTAASNGSVNAMHDSFTPLGGLFPLLLMQLGEVAFGGVGSGLYGMLAFVVLAVFVAGLMVGRSPEYLGKKITTFDMQMATIAVLAPSAAVLVLTALVVSIPEGVAGVANPGVHGFSELLYAYTSAGNNNGSAFAGLTASVPLHNVLLAVAMLIGRYAVALPLLAIAGRAAAAPTVEPSAGTLPTHDGLFVVLLAGTVLLVGALTYFPALALGPVVEHLTLWSGR